MAKPTSSSLLSKEMTMQNGIIVLAVCLASILVLPHRTVAQELVAVYVATNGLDTNPGTIQSPVATLPKAIELAERQSSPGEIVVHGGTYFLEKTVVVPRSKKESRLVIRAADNETAIFDGSILIEKAEPLEGSPGVYTIKGDFPSDEPPPVWEEQSGIHFVKLAGLDSVKRKEYSSVVLDSKTLALRCKDGLPPASRNVRISRSGLGGGFQIYRDHVTIKGIEFRNFWLGKSAAIMVGGNSGLRMNPETGNCETVNAILDSCRASNCHKGFWVYVGGSNTVITHCRARNTIVGIWLSGVDSTVEQCEIVNDPDWLLDKSKGGSDAEKNGIRMYNGCARAIVRNNFITGFPCGIFAKNCRGEFFIENNTVLYGQSRFDGYACAMRSSMAKEYRIRYNIVVGFTQAFGDGEMMPSGSDIDYNVFWGPEYNLSDSIKALQKKGIGLHHVYADPCFALPRQGDYRLLPGSPALNLHDGRIAGAFPQVPGDYHGSPNLRVSLDGKNDLQTRDPSPPSQLPPFSCYVSKQRVIEANLAVSSVAPVKKTRLVINDGPALEKAFKPSDTFELPDKNGFHTLRFTVQDDNGAKSDESVIYVTLRRKGVELAGAPRIVASRHGALVSFRTDQDAWGKLEYHDGSQWIESANSKGLSANADGFPENYGAYREFSSLPLLVAGLAPDMPHRYRLTVSTPFDSTVTEGAFTLNGKPRIMYVSTLGEDAEAGGSREKPFRTLQFALDRALPGDRVRILPGVYFGALILNHGGTAEHPLVIEGLYPNTVILDGVREVARCMRIDHASHVILRNINIRWIKGDGVGVAVNNSESVRITGCRFHNQYWRTSAWCDGTGLLFWRSPNFTVDHCVFTRFSRSGITLDESNGGQVLHNTAAACDVAEIYWRSWWKPSENIAIKYNSLHWCADELLIIKQPLDVLRNKCVIDYNNYGTTFQGAEGIMSRYKVKYGKSVPRPFPYLPCGRSLHYFGDTTQSSHDEVAHSFVTLADWQEFSGQDKHSIFADPKWINPEAGRFDVAADSPNLLPDGKIIGALGYLGDNTNLLPEVVITSPYSREEVKGGMSVTADASDYDGSIKNVEFYADEKRIGQSATPPYRISDVQLTPGRHVITAKAVDDRGATTVSDTVEMSVR